MLLGRSHEQALVRELLDKVRAGRGGGMCVTGEAGIGKSALLRDAADHAVGMQVLTTDGVPPESDLGYATLHRLLLPVAGRLDKLPPHQARALGVALGRSDGPAPDRFLVALATLSLLSEAAVDSPVLCLVDDAQWADKASLSALSFTVRRLQNEPIGVLLAMRSGEGDHQDFQGAVELPLAGLDLDAAAELLAEHDRGRLTQAQRRKILAVANGNPLALQELPHAVRQVGLNEPIPLTARLRDAFLARARQHDEHAQRLLLLLAADGSGHLETISAAAEQLGIRANDATISQLSDLVHYDAAHIRFHHPLMRAAIYHAAPASERIAVHRALAMALRDHQSELHRYAWHLGQAAHGRNEAAARELERSASQAVQRGGQAASAAALARAAELSESDQERGRRLLDAAVAYWHGGDIAQARELLSQAEELDELPDVAQFGRAELRALLESSVGFPADALDVLRPVIPHALRRDVRCALPLLLLYGEVGYRTNSPDVWAQIGEWLDSVDLGGNSAEDALLRLLRASIHARTAQDPYLRPGDLEAIVDLSDPIKLTRAAGMSWALGEHGLRGRLLRKAVKRARAVGAAGTLAWSLEFVVLDELANGRFTIAEAFAEEGFRLATETGQENTACRHRTMLAWLGVLQGQDTARKLAEDVLAEASRRRLADSLGYAHLSLGHLELVGGNNNEAVRHYETMQSRGLSPVQSGLAMHSVPELIEALARSDQTERASEYLQRFEDWTMRISSPFLQAMTARCRALVASGVDVDGEFEHALRMMDESATPFELARTELLFGEHLRRERRRAEAQTHLKAALDTFRRLGASSWADRARNELRAAGGSGPRRRPSLMATLTPQERRIALAVSEGSTNREVAAQLFLSPRTVDYHLRKIFQKTGISSRTELVRLALTDHDQSDDA
ncbi:helix-turn-helix transcriptional regulator [Phytoactinopolyspora halotolerans]|uniref:AAA family ATPase n=1 Tax=Phytoactinopolyspora halotolerans TaxID=1981512 RepID=A0A6L9SBX2_9ACTN|nr:LuxR family transcriptional regulator [Phytoactinopolyspora halotolerans]NEE02519.1 AAA family ATPase [Phytoactinopolyspora halotolerans]